VIVRGWLDAPASKPFAEFREDGCVGFDLESCSEPLESPCGEDVFLDPANKRPGRGSADNWLGIGEGELVQAHDDRGVFQASPDELPVIDIHSL